MFQLFDKENHLNTQASRYLFSTEGHIFPIKAQFHTKPWLDKDDINFSPTLNSRHSTAHQATNRNSQRSPKEGKRKGEKSVELSEHDSAICQPDENPLMPGSNVEIVLEAAESNFTNNVCVNLNYLKLKA